MRMSIGVIYHSMPASWKSQIRLYSFFRYSLTSLYFLHSSNSSRISSKFQYFIELSALNSSQHSPLSGYNQKLIGLQSIYTTLLMSLPSSARSFTYSSISDSSSTIWSQCSCVKMCFIFLVGSISPITSSTQLLTPVEKMTGSHSSLRQLRKFQRFLRLQMFSRHSQSSNHKWKSCLRRGASMQPSSSGLKVYDSTSSISKTTVSLDGSEEGGSSRGLSILSQSIFLARQLLFLGAAGTGLFSIGSFLLLKKPRASLQVSPLDSIPIIVAPTKFNPVMPILQLASLKSHLQSQ